MNAIIAMSCGLLGGFLGAEVRARIARRRRKSLGALLDEAQADLDRRLAVAREQGGGTYAYMRDERGDLAPSVYALSSRPPLAQYLDEAQAEIERRAARG